MGGRTFVEIVGVIILGLVILLGTLAAIQALSITPLWGESGAAWVQAAGAIAAIYFAGRHSIKQAERQHADAMRLQENQARLQLLAATEAIAEVSEVALRRLYSIIKKMTITREQFHDYADGSRRLELKMYAAITKDISEIALHELPSRFLVHKVSAIKTLTLLTSERVQDALKFHRELDAVKIRKFFNMLADTHQQLCLHLIDIEREAVIYVLH